MRVGVITKNLFLYQKIRLALLDRATVGLLGSLGEAFGFDLCLADVSALTEAELADLRGYTQKSNSAYPSGAEPSQSSISIENSDEQSRIIKDEISNGIPNQSYANPLPRIITVGKGGRLTVPFTYEALYSALEGENTKSPELTLGERCAYLRGEKIPLTEVEYALLRMLYEKRGEFVSREELRLGVWDEETDSGVVNVYIYYLRQKLERGEKIINTSRKLGYKIDERYIGG